MLAWLILEKKYITHPPLEQILLCRLPFAWKLLEVKRGKKIGCHITDSFSSDPGGRKNKNKKTKQNYEKKKHTSENFSRRVL